MTIKEAVNKCFRNYVNFSGRASRAEFWKFVLFLLLVSTLLTIINAAAVGPTVSQSFRVAIDSSGQQSQSIHTNYHYGSGWFGVVFGLITFLPWLAVAWRRLHDTNKSGWLCLTPVVCTAVAFAIIYATSKVVPTDLSRLPAGATFPESMRLPGSVPAFLAAWALVFGSYILLLVWLCRRSDPNTNKYGPNPNEVPQ